MNYYNTFTTGTIDSLLMNIGKDGYAIPVDLETDGDRKTEAHYYSKIRKKRMIRNNVGKSKVRVGGPTTDKSRAFGYEITPVDTFLRTYLHKEAMEAVMEDFNYEHEYASPFDNGINQMLLIYKWIIGLQSITKNIVDITKDDLAKLGMDHKSVMDIKIAFDKLFSHEIVKSTYDSGTWFIKLGGRSLLVGEGPGYIKIKMQIPALEDKIKAYHNELQAELDK